MEPPNSGATFGLLHWLWNGVLTLLGGVLMLFIKDFKKSVDGKADRVNVDQQFMAVNTRIQEMLSASADRDKQQQQMHSDNTKRLDEMYKLLLQMFNRGRPT